MPYRLLTEFRALFEGREYRHRASNLGDFVAMHLYEDLVTLGKSEKLVGRVQSHDWVLNSQNRRHGVRARRGDGTFGEKVPRETAISDPEYLVARARVATVEVGIEVKILAKAMIKQIDRVISDLKNQVAEFRRGAGARPPICVGVVGVNFALQYASYEGDRIFRTDGTSRYRHPFQEADEAERRLREYAAGAFEEFIVLRFSATNEAPFPFAWIDETVTRRDYGAALLRISREYDQRF